ncbi:MAG: C39 family peptidase [Candidatus Berkelbacteria bacterium]|nr:C39 family peptidase [Candidatus Berkelbacteria bacterium]
MQRVIKVIVFVIIILFLATMPLVYKKIEKSKVENIPFASLASDFFKKDLNTETKNTKDELPKETFIKVPFGVQAPFANWDALHEEACEEASLIMMNHFLKNTSIDSQEQMEKEIQDLIKWETNHGYKQDVTIKELAQIAKVYYGFSNATAKYDISVDDIKQELASGHPVIIPAAGKILPNPNFRNGGPNYHMLVLTGYDYRGFITNDPGTRNGENFRYSYESLFNAIHDYNSKNMFLGPKAYLVFE